MSSSLLGATHYAKNFISYLHNSPMGVITHHVLLKKETVYEERD